MRPFYLLSIICFSALILSCQSKQKGEEMAISETDVKKVTVNLSKKVKVSDKDSSWEEVEFTEKWNPQKTAIIVTDMWDRHWCESATRRVAAMAPDMNKT